MPTASFETASGRKDPNTMKVRYYFRSSKARGISIEKVFSEIVSEVANNGIPVDRFECRMSRASGLSILANIAEAKSIQGADEISHITGDVHYLSIALDGERTILTVHDLVPLRHLSGFKRFAAWQLWFEIPTRRSAAITCVSSFTKKALLDAIPGLSPKKVRVIPNPLSSVYSPSRLRSSPRVPVLLQVGTGRHNKNLEGVASAIAGLRCHLDIVGRLAPDQIDMLKCCGVSFCSYVDISEEELVERYRRADIVVFASKYEGFGLPITEAQAVGRPVITSNLCSMPEVAGDAALLVDPYNASEIRSAVQTLLENESLRRDLVERGFENVKRFERGVVARQYIQLYQEVWGGR